MAEEFEDSFEPAHQLGKQTVIVYVHFVNEFVEIILMAAAEIDEGLDRLIRIGRNVLTLSSSEDGKHIISEGSEVGDGAVDVGRFVHADEGFIEDGEEITEKAKGDRFFDHGEHLGFITLPSVHL